MGIRSLISRRAAACVLALGLAGSLALAGPAVAQDDRFPAPGKDLAKLLCAVFGGIWFDYGPDVGVWGCQFKGGDITCDGKECWIVVALATPPLKDECDFADGKYGELDAGRFSCRLQDGVLMLECTDKRARRCSVGWAEAGRR